MYLFYLAGVVKNIGSLTTSSETAGAMPSSLSNFSPTAETLCGGHFLGNKKADFKSRPGSQRIIWRYFALSSGSSFARINKRAISVALWISNLR